MKWWLPALFVAGCGGDVYTVDVRISPESCEFSIAGMRSVGVEVVRRTGDRLETIGNVTSCTQIEGTLRVPDLLAPFKETGVIVDGVTAENETVLRIVGYRSAICADSTELACGITCTPVREDQIPEDGVELEFFCDRRTEGELSQRFVGCLSFENINDEQRRGVCNPAE